MIFVRTPRPSGPVDQAFVRRLVKSSQTHPLRDGRVCPPTLRMIGAIDIVSKLLIITSPQILVKGVQQMPYVLVSHHEAGPVSYDGEPNYPDGMCGILHLLDAHVTLLYTMPAIPTPGIGPVAEQNPRILHFPHKCGG